MIDKSVIESIVGTKINKLELYVRAFTHKSALKQYPELKDDYETLEFMGDSVLHFVITKWLFDKYQDEKEGFLTRARTKIVRSDALAWFASELKLDQIILMDEKGLNNGWNKNPKILEDCFEALIGAIYLDLGILSAKQFILDTVTKYEVSMDDDNYKDQLMRYCQANKQPAPEYKIESSKNGIFCVSLTLNGVPSGCGYATTKKQAEQNVAENVLKHMNLKVPRNASYGPEAARTGAR
jgi:ribonuclease III